MEKYLYKKTPPIKEYYLRVDRIHSLYVSHYGSPNKPVVIFLHGGPGGGSDPVFSRLFNSRQYHVIVFDQRGCGKSRPLGELKNNNTTQLILDIEKIRVANNFDKIILSGGSWGASLSLLYAIKYPQNVSYYIISGLCLMDDPQGEVFTPSLKVMYPELWNNYLSLSSKKKPLDRVKHYFQEIKKGQKRYINTWFRLEDQTRSIDPDSRKSNKRTQTQKRIIALMESYYYSQRFFLPSNYILNNISKISGIPGILIHGRLDVICNPEDSYRVAEKLPQAKLCLIQKAGHSFSDPPITKAIVQATRELSKKAC